MSTTLDKPAPKRALPPLMRLSDAAAERLAGLYAKGEAGRTLRIAVSTKGCSGLSYDISWVDAAGPTDEVVSDKGVTLLVDRKATLFLIGTVMDYEVKAMSAGFTFTNPNEKGRCGCGESFHV
jgi:iron-sulfur cluster assembly protein